jgi:hypothetical protein
MRDGVGGFEGGDDAFHFGQRAESGEGFVVGGVVVVDTTGVAVVAVLGSDCRVVEEWVSSIWPSASARSQVLVPCNTPSLPP